MSWTLDIIIALIIGLTVYFGYKNGLVKTAISAVSLVVAVILTLMFTTPLAEALKSTSIADSIRETTEQQIADIIINGSYSITDLAGGASEEFDTMLKLAGLEFDDLPDVLDDALAKTSKETAEIIASTYAEKIAVPIVDLMATLIAVFILFFGTQILLVIISKLLDFIAKLPILRTFNTGGGLVIGIVLAFIRVCVFCLIVNVLIENSAFLDIEFISNLNPDKTLLFSIFSNIDIFEFFIS